MVPTAVMGVAQVRVLEIAASNTVVAIGVAMIGFGPAGCRFGSSAAEIRQDGLRLNLVLAQRSEIIGYSFFFIESDLPRVGADKALAENAARKSVKVFLLDGAQHTRADFRDGRNGVERDATLLALLAQFFSERSHGELRRAERRLSPHRDDTHHRRSLARAPEEAFGGTVTYYSCDFFRRTMVNWALQVFAGSSKAEPSRPPSEERKNRPCLGLSGRPSNRALPAALVPTWRSNLCRFMNP